MAHSTGETLNILFEDNHLIIVNKRSGDIVQGDKTGDKPLSDVVKDYLRVKYNKPGNIFCGVVHRIDRPVSGAVIFAKTSKALSRMNAAFQEKMVHKTYWAVTENATPAREGKLEGILKKNEKQNKSYVYDKPIHDGKKSQLEYLLVGSGDRYHFVEVRPLTGRHHQIRVQLAHAGCIIKGDLKYGAKRSNKDGSICLHARAITFKHPTTKEKMRVIAPPPSEPLWNAFVKKKEKK
jgi:23S rRNA pseudouridine1911/1915/1917 synthase